MYYKVEFHTQKSRILLKLLPEFQTTLSGGGGGGDGRETSIKNVSCRICLHLLMYISL